MHRTIAKGTLPAAAFAALALIASGCGSGTTSGGGGSGTTVNAQNIAFDPSSITVPANTSVTITFTNKDSTKHSLTFDDNSQSVDADGGSTQTLVFTSPSSGTTIKFHCKYHSSMHGTINVGSGGAGAGGSSSASDSSSGGGGGY